MDQVFELMRLKFSHPEYRHETLPEKADGTVLKIRWRVVLADGSLVVLQRPFRNMPMVLGNEIDEAVRKLTKKKYPNLSEFSLIRVCEKESDNVCDLQMDRQFRLPLSFPGPKFVECHVVQLECINDEYSAWDKARPERQARQEAKLKADAARKERLIAEKRAAREAAAQDGGVGRNVKAGKGRGRGRGRGH